MSMRGRIRAIIGSFGVAAVCSLAPSFAQAQDTVPPVPQPNPEKGGLARAAELVDNLFSKPLHLTVSSVAPGGGFTLGVGYAPKPWSGGRYFTSMRTAMSVKRYWIAEGAAGWLDDDFARVELFGRVRQMTRLGYFGLGTDSPRADETNFLMTEHTIGSDAWIKFQPWLKVGGRLERISNDLGSGRSPVHPSIETRFTDLTAPGLIEPTPFVHAQLDVRITRPTPVDPYVNGGDYRASYGIFRGHTPLESQSFNRFELEATQRIQLPKPSRRITLHVWAAETRPDGDARVPFYMMQTIGGSGSLRAYQDLMIGGDETQATLRGFTNYRFRDLSLLLLQAEYRMKLYGPLDLSFFSDNGNVAPRLADIRLGNLHHDYGFGLSVMKHHSTAARFDFGFGGGEGMHIFFSVGKISTR